MKLASGAEVGAPKPSKASKKNKKSWRKNVDMTEVNEVLEEKRFEERTGGNVADKPDDALFTLDTNIETEVSDKRKKRRENKKLKCFAILDGLPGAPDPVPVRNFTLTPEQRENPIVKDMKLKKIKGGKIQKKHLDRVKDRKSYLEKKEAMKEEAKTRRRTKFDFDLWGNEEKVEDEKLPSKDWVNTEAMIHSAIGTFVVIIYVSKVTFILLGTSQHVPRFSKDRTITTGTKVAAVEVPDSGASYNPSLEEHQELLWKGNYFSVYNFYEIDILQLPWWRLKRKRNSRRLKD